MAQIDVVRVCNASNHTYCKTLQYFKISVGMNGTRIRAVLLTLIADVEELNTMNAYCDYDVAHQCIRHSFVTTSNIGLIKSETQCRSAIG